MKILLFGKNGQVGWELQRSLVPLGEVVALDQDETGNLVGDLTNFEGVRQTIQTIRPDVIVNAAAYTAVDRAETEEERELVYKLNAAAPALLAREAASLGCLLVHYSTDYVFDGSGAKPWREGDATNPLNQYGLSKAKGEQAIQESGCRHLIFRTSWVYGAHGNNFIKTMLRLMSEREELKVVSDQTGAPTGAELLADITAHAICRVKAHPELQGLYHLTPTGESSWYKFAVFIAAEARKCGASLKIQDIHPIETVDYPTPAERPRNSRLDTTKLREKFNLSLPDWRQGVTRVLQEITTHLQ